MKSKGMSAVEFNKRRQKAIETIKKMDESDGSKIGCYLGENYSVSSYLPMDLSTCMSAIRSGIGMKDYDVIMEGLIMLCDLYKRLTGEESPKYKEMDEVIKL